MWILIIIAVVLIALAIEHPWLWAVIAGIVGLFIWGMIWSSRSEKKEKEREEREDRERRERIIREDAIRKKQEEERLAQLIQKLSANPMIQTAIPTAAIQCARQMLFNQLTKPYQKITFSFGATSDELYIATGNVVTQNIPYAQYGFSSINDPFYKEGLSIAARNAFNSAIKNEFNKCNVRCRTQVKIDDYGEYKNYIVICEIGFADSISW